MSYGKSICKQLKAIRRQIAEENDIPLEIPTCTYQGPCAGTCPQCESEVRFLEKELARRITLGKAATVAGIAVTLATPAAAQVNTIDTAANGHSISCGNHPTQADYSKPTRGIIPAKTKVPDTVAQIAVLTLRGTVTDSSSHEPVPFANVILKRKGTVIAGAQTDFDGNFKLEAQSITELQKGTDTLEITCVGYHKLQIPITDAPLPAIYEMSPSGLILESIMIGMPVQKYPRISPDYRQTYEQDGIHVIVK
ncbi:MAG: carboxypeptidase-like regulatory domain-containing protein [Bacteroidales bacterium]|nr:carboxypeptidase-like regulatory domain-containing protein [Bacteroidales bacterium]